MPRVPAVKISDWALVVPMANEENDFRPFINELQLALDDLGGGAVYLIADKVSRDRTFALCQELAAQDPRFRAVWAAENRNVVDAYLRGYREALQGGHEYIIEMDAGLSHDPALLPQFLEHLRAGYECVYGSRFLPGHEESRWNLRRKVLSRGGTLLANLLLGTNLRDMTSGYQGFPRAVAAKFAAYPLLSKAHFYQTELRYLLRNHRAIEVPVTYRAPSPNVSRGAVVNSFQVLFHYFWRRLTGRAVAL
jgi:dolichol-phosphate mannosyltransferase